MATPDRDGAKRLTHGTTYGILAMDNVVVKGVSTVL
jgi:hypothetical protein